MPFTAMTLEALESELIAAYAECNRYRLGSMPRATVAKRATRIQNEIVRRLGTNGAALAVVTRANVAANAV